MKWNERFFWLAVLVGLFLFLRACGEGCRIFKGKDRLKDTISVRVDTVFVHIKADTVYEPDFIGVSNTIYQTRWKHDTLTELEVRVDPADTAAIIARFNQTAFYSDKQRIGDYGTITINDTLFQNRIISRGFKTDLKIPEVTKTITIRDKRTILYFDVSAMGSKDVPLHSVGGGFSLKLKSEYIFGLQANVTKSGEVFYSIKGQIPIRLKKR